MEAARYDAISYSIIGDRHTGHCMTCFGRNTGAGYDCSGSVRRYAGRRTGRSCAGRRSDIGRTC